MEDRRWEDTAEVDAELREKVWSFTQRILVALVIFMAGVLVGFIRPLAIAPLFRPIGIQGPAAELQDKVNSLSEKTQALTKERDTLRSQIAIVERDKKEVERQLQEAQARVGVEAVPALQ
jgi:hypothetical protein